MSSGVMGSLSLFFVWGEMDKCKVASGESGKHTSNACGSEEPHTKETSDLLLSGVFSKQLTFL
jgi:hypothetical protein